MDLALSDEDISFREAIRYYLRGALPEALRHKVLTGRRLHKEDFMTWHRILAAKGWVAPSWPLERGGTPWSALQKHLFEEECYAAGAPPIQPPGVKLAAPVIMSPAPTHSLHLQSHRWPRTISTAVRRPSMAAPMKYKKTSLPARCCGPEVA